MAWHMHSETDTGHIGICVWWARPGKNNSQPCACADSPRKCGSVGPVSAIRWVCNILSVTFTRLDRSGRAPARVRVPATAGYPGKPIGLARAICRDDERTCPWSEWAAILELLHHCGRSGQFAGAIGARTLRWFELADETFREMAATPIRCYCDSELSRAGGFFSDGQEACYRYFYSSSGESAGLSGSEGAVWLRRAGYSDFQFEAA